MKTKKSRKTATSIRKRRSKYINTQRHKASCGPIAIANAIKWFGIETSYDAVMQFCAGIRAYHPTKGMWPFQMRYSLLTLKLPFKVRRKFSPEELDAEVAKGRSMILIYDTLKNGSHAAFLDASSETQYRVWNKIKGQGPWYDKKVIWDDIERTGCRQGYLYAFIFQLVTSQNKGVQAKSSRIK